MYKPEETIIKFRRTDLTEDNFRFLEKVKKLTAKNQSKQTISKLVNNIIFLAREKKLLDEITGQDLSGLY